MIDIKKEEIKLSRILSKVGIQLLEIGVARHIDDFHNIIRGKFKYKDNIGSFISMYDEYSASTASVQIKAQVEIWKKRS